MFPIYYQCQSMNCLPNWLSDNLKNMLKNWWTV